MKHAGRNFDLSNGSSSSWIFKFSKYLISTCFWWNKTPVSRFLGSILGKNHFSHAGKALFIAKIPVSNNSKSLWHQHYYHNLTLSARTHPQHNLHLLANPFSSAISNSYSNNTQVVLVSVAKSYPITPHRIHEEVLQSLSLLLQNLHPIPSEYQIPWLVTQYLIWASWSLMPFCLSPTPLQQMT